MQMRIFQLPKTAMQEGRGLTKRWVLEFEPDSPRGIEPLMGWTSSPDTRQQLRLWFDTEEEAIIYAERHGYMYSLDRPRERDIRPKSYAENFRTDRLPHRRDALAHRRQLDAVLLVLVDLPAGADPEHEPAPGQVVQGQGRHRLMWVHPRPEPQRKFSTRPMND